MNWIKNKDVVCSQIDTNNFAFYNIKGNKIFYTDTLTYLIYKCFEEFSNVVELVQVLYSNETGITKKEFQKLVLFKLIFLKKNEIIVRRANTGFSILLIDPPCDKNSVGARGPSTSLINLSSVLRKEGHNTYILDLRSVSKEIDDKRKWIDYLLKYIDNINPKIIGVTSVSSTIDNALFIGNFIKLLYKDSFLVLGGHHVSYEWQYILTNHSFVDYIIRGDGDISFLKLVNYLYSEEQNINELKRIQGVSFKLDNGEPYTTGWSEQVSDINQQRNIEVYHNVLNLKDYRIEYARILASRGCPHCCIFCSTSAYQIKAIRYRDVNNIIEEIKFYLENFKIKGFSFDDDIFTFKKQRVYEICDKIIENNLNHLNWGCNTRIEYLNVELIEKLYSAGCRMVLIGVESINELILKKYCNNKGHIINSLPILRRALDLKMELQLNFIIGLPEEKYEDILGLKKIISLLPEATFSFNFLNIFPGTQLSENINNYGYKFISQENSEKYNIYKPTVYSNAFSAEHQLQAYLELQGLVNFLQQYKKQNIHS